MAALGPAVIPAFQLEREIIKKGGGIHQLSLGMSPELPQTLPHWPEIKQTRQMQQRLVSTDFILGSVGP